MILAGDILTLGLPGLGFDVGLLLPNPFQLGYDVAGINSVKKDQGEPLISADNIDWEDLPLYFDWPELLRK